MKTAFQQVFLEVEAGRLNWTDFTPINIILEQAKFDLMAKPQAEQKPQAKVTPKSGTPADRSRSKLRTCNKFQ